MEEEEFLTFLNSTKPQPTMRPSGFLRMFTSTTWGNMLRVRIRIRIRRIKRIKIKHNVLQQGNKVDQEKDQKDQEDQEDAKDPHLSMLLELPPQTFLVSLETQVPHYQPRLVMVRMVMRMVMRMVTVMMILMAMVRLTLFLETLESPGLAAGASAFHTFLGHRGQEMRQV